MAVYKSKTSGKYFYDFQLNGRRFCESTKTTNKRIAMEIEDQAGSEVLRFGYLPKGI